MDLFVSVRIIKFITVNLYLDTVTCLNLIQGTPEAAVIRMNDQVALPRRRSTRVQPSHGA